MLNEDAQEILYAAISVANAAADGFDWSDLGSLVNFPSAISGWANGVDNLKATFATDEGRDEIEDYVADNFDIPDDALEEKIEKSLAFIYAAFDLYATWTEDDIEGEPV